MEWRRWCAVVRRQWCEARRCDMAPPRAGASSKLLMAAFQLRLAANPRMFNTHRSTTWPPEKAQKTNTNPFLQKLDAPRRCGANPREESRVRIADLNVLYRHQ